MRILLAPDKFKGTLSAQEVCDAMRAGIHAVDERIEVLQQPLADGGEGTLDLLEQTTGAKRIQMQVHDPLYRLIDSYYLRKADTAFVEMAMASGLQWLNHDERNPMKTSTYGTGEFIRHAVENGANHIYMMIGGSATNDGGIGMAEALGYVFKGKYGRMNQVNGSSLNYIEEIKYEGLIDLSGVQFTVLTDVQNVLLGTKGASNVYGRQKGADEDMVIGLDEGLRWLSKVLGNGCENIPGAGAAGGLGYGAMSFLGAELKPGIQSVMEITSFEQKLAGIDLIITGEGKMDLQTVEGKVIAGVSETARQHDIPFAVVCGLAEERESVQEQIAAWDILPLVNEETSVEMALGNAFDLVKSRTKTLIGRFLESNHNHRPT